MIGVTVSKLVVMVETVAVDVGVGESYVIVRVVACPFDEVVIVVNHSGAGGMRGIAIAARQTYEHPTRQRAERQCTYCSRRK